MEYNYLDFLLVRLIQRIGQIHSVITAQIYNNIARRQIFHLTAKMTPVQFVETSVAEIVLFGANPHPDDRSYQTNY